MNRQENETALRFFVEASRDLAAESRGEQPSIGEMQRLHPHEYQNARRYVERWGNHLEAVALSLEQAQKLFELIHQENEWVSAIPDVQGAPSPVNVDLLEHLVALETNPRARAWVNALHEVLALRPVDTLTLLHLIRLERKRRGRATADAKHLRTNTIKQQVLEMWASGDYPTRNACAQAAEKKFRRKVAYSTIRNWLQGTDDPPARC